MHSNVCEYFVGPAAICQTSKGKQ